MCLSEEKNCIQRKWNNKEFLHCCKKVISSFKELYKTPAKHAKKIILLHTTIVLQSTYQEIWVLFSGSLLLRKSGFLFFFPCFFLVAWKRVSAQKVACFHSKKHKEHHHFGFIFNSEVLNLEVDSIFYIIYKPYIIHYINFSSAFTPFLEISVHNVNFKWCF